MASSNSPRESEIVSTGTVVHEVKSVYVYIPAELSATGFELKINGTVRIVRKVINGAWSVSIDITCRSL